MWLQQCQKYWMLTTVSHFYESFFISTYLDTTYKALTLF